MKLGFIGVGNLGSPICSQFVHKGHDVKVYDLDEVAVDKAISFGASRAESPADAARQADVLFTCLPGPREVNDVAFGEQGVVSAAKPNMVFVDLTTSFADESRRTCAKLAEHGIAMLEAPVGNGVVGAREARSSVICGGDIELFARIKPLFECFATTIHHVGDVGNASIVKSIDILIAGVNLAVACEGFLLGARAGIDPDVLFDVVSTNSGSSEQLKRRMKRKIIARDFSPEGSMALALKDLQVTLDVAEKSLTPTPYGSLLRDQFIAAIAKGWGAEDWACIMKVSELTSDVQVRRAA